MLMVDTGSLFISLHLEQHQDIVLYEQDRYQPS
jgi:hypothetical protein